MIAIVGELTVAGLICMELHWLKLQSCGRPHDGGMGVYVKRRQKWTRGREDVKTTYFCRRLLWMAPNSCTVIHFGIAIVVCNADRLCIFLFIILLFKLCLIHSVPRISSLVFFFFCIFAN